MSGDEDVKVLYIVGWGRSGSTLVGNILNECPGFFHTGELNYIWENGLLRNRPCGCGRSLLECEVWSSVLSHVFDGDGESDLKDLIVLRDHSPQNRAVLGDVIRLRSIAWEAHQTYLTALAYMYRAIKAVTGCGVIVDSSKSPAYGYLLGHVPGLRVYYLHLVRDARATAFSWQRKVRRKDASRAEFMERRTLFENAKRWTISNAVSEFIGSQRTTPYLRVRYEDFVHDPVRAIQAIVEFVDEAVDQLPFVTDHDVALDTNHTVWGNPARVVRGIVHVQQDDAWVGEMEASSRWATVALTWPLLLHYGYLPTRPHRVWSKVGSAEQE